MKHFFYFCVSVLTMVLATSCNNELSEDDINKKLPTFCDVSNSNGWSNIRYFQEGAAIFTKNHEGASSVQKTFMIIPADTLGLVSVYGEFEEDGFPKYLAFNDAIILIDNRTETTFDASLFIGEQPVWTGTGLEFDTKATRAWADNNWVRNTCAVGGVITSSIGIGVGVSLTTTGVGTATGLVTIGTSVNSLKENLEVLFGPAQEESLTEDIMQRISDQGWDKVCDSLTEHENEFLDKWFKKHVGALDKLNWADITLGLIDDIWGKTITESQKRLALLHAHRGYAFTTGAAKNITEYTVELEGYISPEAITPLNKYIEVEYGIVLYPTAEPNKKMHKYDIVGSGGSFSFLFRGLDYDTEYKYMVYYHDKTNQISRFGLERTFKTRGEDDVRDMLIQFYNNTDGNNWYRNDNWCSDKPIDKWYGVNYYDHTPDNGIDDMTVDIEFYEGNNLNGIVDFSGWDKLARLWVADNNITSIDVTGCTKLDDLNCSRNGSISLRVQNCPALQRIDCFGNNLTSLDASGCTELCDLECYDNPMTSLNISGTGFIYFDDQFSRWIVTHITTLDASDCTELQGFIDPYDGTLYESPLTSIDLSGCEELEIVSVGGEKLSSLNVAQCPELVELYCPSAYSLSSLDISGCAALEIINCAMSQLSSLDVSGCKSLKKITCDENQLSSLDVSGCDSLEYLTCSANKLTSLNVSGCISLKKITCDENQLSSLDVSGCDSLEYLTCSANKLTSLDASGCSELKTLNFEDNYSLTSLNISKTRIKDLTVDEYKNLESINVSGCTELKYLRCPSMPNLTSINASGCTSLYLLDCQKGKLTSLDISGCQKLTELYCQNNTLVKELPSNLPISKWKYDKRYSYYSKDIYYNNEFLYTQKYWKYNYTDHHGWYHSNEPKSGYTYGGN